MVNRVKGWGRKLYAYIQYIVQNKMAYHTKKGCKTHPCEFHYKIERQTRRPSPSNILKRVDNWTSALPFSKREI